LVTAENLLEMREEAVGSDGEPFSVPSKNPLNLVGDASPRRRPLRADAERLELGCAVELVGGQRAHAEILQHRDCAEHERRHDVHASVDQKHIRVRFVDVVDRTYSASSSTTRARADAIPDTRCGRHVGGVNCCKLSFFTSLQADGVEIYTSRIC